MPHSNQAPDCNRIPDIWAWQLLGAMDLPLFIIARFQLSRYYPDQNRGPKVENTPC